jgi:hypothetical protein
MLLRIGPRSRSASRPIAESLPKPQPAPRAAPNISRWNGAGFDSLAATGFSERLKLFVADREHTRETVGRLLLAPCQHLSSFERLLDVLLAGIRRRRRSASTRRPIP